MLELDEIIFDNTNYDRRIFALHGAAVEWKGKGYLFLAATASGKTTLASYLTSQGFGYITDDCILLDCVDFQVYPCHTLLHLRDGGVDVLKLSFLSAQAGVPIPKILMICPAVLKRMEPYSPVKLYMMKTTHLAIFFPFLPNYFWNGCGGLQKSPISVW